MRKLSLWAPVAVVIIANIYFSSQPGGSTVIQQFPLPYWLGHFGGYAFFSFFLYRALAGGLSRWNGGAAWAAFLTAFIYGILDEFYQSFIPGRESSYLDVFIDGAGALSALTAARFWFLLRGQENGSSKAGLPEVDGDGEKERPRAAGNLLYFAVIAAALFIFPITGKLLLLLSAVTLIFLIGLLDSASRLNRLLMLLGQGLAAIILVSLFGVDPPQGFLHYLDRIPVTGAVIYPLMVVWVVFMTNSLNLFAGLDGVAAGTSAVIGAVLAVAAYLRPGFLIPALGLIILGACLGFYPYNTPPPLIPLGRNGTMLAGFSLAVLVLLRMDSTLFPYLLYASLPLYVYPAAEITFLAVKRLAGAKMDAVEQRKTGTPGTDRLTRFTRAVYLMFVLAISGIVIAVLLRDRAPIPALLLLLPPVLFSLPGVVYLAGLLGFINRAE